MNKEDKKAIIWLQKELPGLVEKGVLPECVATELRKHYQMKDETERPSILLTVFAVIGATLVGLGIILILAHNWEQITHINRLALLLGQLFAAQLLVGYVIWRKSEDEAWREGGGTILSLSFAAALALIGQTYNLAGGQSLLLISWLLLTLPLAYLLGALAPALFYLVGVIIWLFWGAEGMLERQATWFLLLLLLPYYWRLLQEGYYEKKTVLLSWCLTAVFYLSFFMLLQPKIAELDLVIYSELFALTYLVGKIWFDGETHFLNKAFKAAGISGLTALALFLTFQETWHKTVWLKSGATEQGLAALGALLLCGLLWYGKRGLVFALQPLVALAGMLLFEFYGPWASAALFNLDVMLLGVRSVVQGVKKNSFGRLNAGMLLIGAVILLRFFDFNFSYALRGSVFVGVGVLFLIVNGWLARRKGRKIR